MAAEPAPPPPAAGSPAAGSPAAGSPAAGSPAVRGGAAIAGLLLVAAFASLFSAVGFRGEQARGFLYLAPSEALFWLAHAFLLVPGLLMLGVAASPGLAAGLPRLAALARSRSSRLAALSAFALLLFFAAELGRERLLLGMPITGEERSIAFGAAVVASGRLAVPAPPHPEAFSYFSIGLFDGRLAALDYPGAIVLGAAIRRFGLGRWPWSLLVAASGLAFCFAARRLGGDGAAALAGAVWLVSPMVVALSATTHPQLLARSFVALGVAAYLALVLGRPSIGGGLLLGLAVGLGVLSRPLEVAALFAPVACHLSALAFRQQAWKRVWLAAAGVVAAAAGLFALYNDGVTGRWHTLGRVAVPAAERVLFDFGPRELIGTNLGFNVAMLGIWLLGPLGLVAVGLGLADGRAAPRVLAAGVALDLGIALFHKDTGIHLVGPIHYSEAAVPLLLLAVLGLQRAWRERTRLGVGPATAAGLLAGYLTSLVVFDAVHALTLRDQARVQRVPYAAIERAGLDHAAIVAEPPYRLWELRPELDAVRAWSVLYPPPDPFFRDDVVFLEPRLDAATLATILPDRDLYRMTYHAEGEPVRLVLIRPRMGPSP